MSTETIQSTGTTAPNDWTLAAGASKPAAVNQPDDDASSYISSGTTINLVQTFTLSPAALAVGDTVTQIDIVARGRRPGTGSNANFVVGYSFAVQGGGTTNGESGTLTTTANWTDFSYSVSGLSFVFGGSLQLYVKNTQARDAWITTLYCTITYTPAGGQPPRTAHQFALRSL
jgi:hypothetical protein